MDQNLKTDSVTLTKTLCGHLGATQFGDLSAAGGAPGRRERYGPSRKVWGGGAEGLRKVAPSTCSTGTKEIGSLA